MKISTKEKKYLFKFSSRQKTQDWSESVTKLATLGGAKLEKV